MKPKKTRQLILTNHRLLCAKHPSSKHPQKGVVIKHEFLLRKSSAPPNSGDKGKDKDSNYIISAEYRGGREFIVINVCVIFKTHMPGQVSLIYFNPVFKNTSLSCSRRNEGVTVDAED
jgi:hypothetical protein